MKNKYSSMLLGICLLCLVFISGVQIYGLSIMERDTNNEVYNMFTTCLVLTLTCSTIGISVFLAREAIAREIKRKAYIDVTGVQNKRSCIEHMDFLDRQDDTLDVALAMFDLNNLKRINDNIGHDKGDELIKNFARLLQETVKKKAFIGRFGGDEFVLIAEGCSYQQMNQWMEKLEHLVEEYNKHSDLMICFAKGYEISNREHYYMMDDLLKEADKKMYHNKRSMKKILIQQKKDNKEDLTIDIREEEMNQYSCVCAEECVLGQEYYEMFQIDRISGLLTCEAFLKRVGDILVNSSSAIQLAVICSDISDFRYINDNYGYQVGNHVLKVFGEKFAECERTLSAARIFSDNFASILDVTGLSEQEVILIVQNINSEIAKKIEVNYKRNYFVVNTGIYMVKDRQEKAETIYNNSNTARKMAKNSYQHIQFYSDEIEIMEKKRAEMLANFHRAIELDEFQVYLQPKIDGKSKDMCSTEALVRWISNDGQMRYPGEFIPLFEQTGDIVELDYYVYQKVFEWLKQRIVSGKKILPVSMNVSQVHLFEDNKFITYIKELQQEYKIPSKFIIFEITESAYIQNVTVTSQIIEKLHVMGFTVSMDDFGSGYSSLNSLKTLYFDEIKIDKEFLVNGMNEEGKAVMQQMIQLIKKLNKRVVCEGVETEEEVNFLMDESCDVLQGYYFSRPRPMVEFDDF